MSLPQEPTFSRLEPKAMSAPTAAQVSTGLPVSKVKVLRIMEDEAWEEFTAEWLWARTAPRGEYVDLRRYGGAGDKGLDVVAFTTKNDFDGEWDSYQCKRYGQAGLMPTNIYLELAKLIYYSFTKAPPFNKVHRTPRRHTFVAPHGAGTTLSHLLKNPQLLREKLRENWVTYCQDQLAEGLSVPLEGELLQYFDAFDFALFGDVTPATLVTEHAATPYHVARFGGGLPPRPEPDAPPSEPTESESTYVRKMLDAYGDHLGATVDTPTDLSASNPPLRRHFDRQRELFYCAESLKSYSRDTLPEGAYKGLQDEVYDGVFEVCEKPHPSGYERMREVVQAAGALPIAGHALATVAKNRDKQGVCHQLANEDRVTWVKKP
jgi:hypothetical protein